MSHLYESGFSVGEVPWHGLGEVIPEDQKLSIAQGLSAAGMNWDVYTRPAGYQHAGQMVTPMTTTTDEDNNEIDIPRNKFTMRRMLVEDPNDKGKTIEQEQVLGLVGGAYQVVQNSEMFEFFQPFLDRNEAELHTAGSLANGRIVWVLAKLNRDPMQIVDGDEVNKYLLLSSSHDGSKALRVGFTPIRVVCANTLAMAHQNRSSKMLRLKHTKKVITNLENIRETINTINADFEATAAQYRLLVRKGISSADLDKYIKLCFTTEKEIQAGLSTKKQTIIDAVKGRFESQANSLPGVRGTVWAAYNAVTEHYTWAYGGEGGKKNTPLDKRNNRISSLWLGSNQTKNEQALKVALEMAS